MRLIISLKNLIKVDYNDEFLTTLHGPQWRILVIGAGQLSSYIAQFAQALDYQVIVRTC